MKGEKKRRGPETGDDRRESRCRKSRGSAGEMYRTTWKDDLGRPIYGDFLCGQNEEGIEGLGR